MPQSNEDMKRGRGKQRDASSSGSNPQLFVDTSQQQYANSYGNPGAVGFDMPSAGAYDPGANYDPYYSPQHQGGPPMQPAGQNYPGFQVPGQEFLQNPMVTNMAMQYGQQFVGQGSQFVQQNIESYVATSRLKYYFAVDNAYVGKKLFLLMFPYTNSRWDVGYDQQNSPVAPRMDVNAPDLYIPVMAFVTYILTAGLVMGTQNRFNPEQLGIQSSTALGWLIIEILLLMFTLYVMAIQTSLRYLDIMAYAGYKYVGMILILISGLFFQSVGFYAALAWFSASLAFFLVRTLKLQILPHANEANTHGSKRRVYLLLVIAGIQPLLMWWLTSYIMFPKKY